MVDKVLRKYLLHALIVDAPFMSSTNVAELLKCSNVSPQLACWTGWT